MKIYIPQSLDIIEVFYESPIENYADFEGEKDEIRVYKAEDNDRIIGFGIDDINDLSKVKAALKTKVAVIAKYIRTSLRKTQKEFTVVIKKEGNLRMSYRKYLRVEAMSPNLTLDIDEVHEMLQTFAKLPGIPKKFSINKLWGLL